MQNTAAATAIFIPIFLIFCFPPLWCRSSCLFRTTLKYTFSPTIQYLYSYKQKSIPDQLRRWDFCLPAYVFLRSAQQVCRPTEQLSFSFPFVFYTNRYFRRTCWAFFTLPSLPGSYKQQSRHLYWTLLRFSRYPPTPATSQKSYSLFLYIPRSYP